MAKTVDNTHMWRETQYSFIEMLSYINFYSYIEADSPNCFQFFHQILLPLKFIAKPISWSLKNNRWGFKKTIMC